ncbi:hypothetical protein ACEWY4_018982 [Coilia grayii]|uniref:Cubilin n=1 Tax=Coilia grayii TaxID=363190 RepID=A0ABD1JF29_9TELE
MAQAHRLAWLLFILLFLTGLQCEQGEQARGRSKRDISSDHCTCPAEWYGPHCTSRYDDCAGGGQDLCEHGVCIDSDRVTPNEPKYKCICDAGWMSPPGTPACTADVDECSLPNKPCSTNPPVQCFNTMGSYYCGACPAGWQGNGYSCQDVNECETNNGGCSTSPMVPCMNTMGSYHCGQCPAGYEGDGKTCTQANICATNNGGCYPLATCTAVPGSNTPVCTCPPGYVGNGYGPTGCTQVSDICQTNNPCVNGQCVSTTTGYICNCDPGWAGTNCDQNVNECASNPCQNGGTCTDGINGYTCTCTSQWTGPQCQTPQQECGGVLTGPAGTFSYPTNPGHDQYPHQVSCAWVIRVDATKIIRITFPYFDLENSATCAFDFLQIHDGESASAYMLGKYCGSAAPAELFSSHNSLYFWFRADSSVNAGGFTVAWESRTPVCGGELTESYGNINSPGYPGNYPPSRDCYWTVNVNPGLLITFAFGTLSLEQHPNCNFDFLEIRDGLLPEDPVLGKYCTTGSPPPLRTTGPAAWVHFHSDYSVSDRGFHITYTTSPSDPGCGGTYTDSEGIIISPNWPNNYAHNRQCIYIIRMPRSENVALNFTHMDLESHSSCTFDYVEVRDGTGETDPLIGKYCGSTLPAPITSRSNGLWIRFKSDGSVTRAGFRALYEVGEQLRPTTAVLQTNRPKDNHMALTCVVLLLTLHQSCVLYVLPTPTACGGTLSGTGQIRTPFHPDAYPHNKECEWVINQPPGYVVTLNFLTFDVEGSTSCRFDYVEVRDGSSSSSPVIGRYCGNQMPSMLQSTQRSMYIRFKTDASVSNHGFTAAYDSIIEGCGDTLTASSGSFHSPGHPSSYPHGANCTWYISVPAGNLIRLSFTSFNLEYHQNCNYDYVEVYDNGTAQTGTLLGRYCGRSVPPSLTSTDNMMTLLFVSDSSQSTEGFAASYVSINASTDCSEVFTAPTGEFFSPNYPNYYPMNRECVFKIIVAVNMQIMLNFTDFELEGSPPTCAYDYVEIRDGGYETSPLIGRYCSTSRPPITVSHSNRLWIKFRSDHSVTRSGFRAHWDGTQTGCGGTLTTSTGGLTSPNYPLPYHPNVECYWLIKSSEGSRPTLTFGDFHLETSSSCTYDYLEVYDGNSTNALKLAHLCGSQLPAPIAASKEQLFVKLRTDSSVSAGGFIATYTTRCQGIVISNQNRGFIESLEYPNNYPDNSLCSWTIQATMGNTINYTFMAFDLESGTLCNFDNVTLYNGPNATAPLIGTYCGNSPPPASTTTGTSLHVVFRSDISRSQTGFRMLWYQNGCGEDLYGPEGNFTSPFYPDRYPANRECIWYIQTAAATSITLTIFEFDVEYHPDCSYDLLEVYGGPDLSAPRLAQLCTTRPPDNPLVVSSTGNFMTVRFKSDSSVGGRGFAAKYDEIHGGCGGSVVAPSGEIHSPSYPDNYPNNVDCSWVISVDESHRVLFNFTDLDIERNVNCTYDYVAIHDGPTAAFPLLAKVCGTERPAPISATGNVIHVRFRSDSSRTHRGFSAQFSEACGSTIVADDIGGAIASPRYPYPYPPNQSCSWIIKAQEPFNHVTLSFTDFELEMVYSNCSHDSVEVLDGDNYQAPSVGKFCGTEVPHPITSFSDALVVNFTSDPSVSKKGFRATYAASTSSCGGNFHMESGAFNSPNYPDAYPPNIECVWKIHSSPGNRLQLSFVMFQLQASTSCNNDYLEIREANSTGPLIGRFCGDSLPSNYTSVIGHVLWLKFVSDASVSGAGFRVTFSLLFGNEITGSSGQIASPLWPRTYPNNADYRWTISVDSDYYIYLRFLEIDIEDLYNCFYDNLRIFDGPNVHAISLGTFCGLSLPDPVRSTGSTMTLEFKSDTTVGGRGFLIEWTAVQSTGPVPTIAPGACGGALVPQDTPRFFFSPNWPNPYQNNLECSWVIRSPDSIVELNMLFMEIEDSPACSYDSLVIRDGETNLSPVLATLCGRQLPGPIHSTGDAMHIRFTTDSSVYRQGFNASYSRGCGGLIHTDRGVVSTPRYPQNYPPGQDCSWHVMVTPGFRVFVTFQSPFQVQGFGIGCSSGDYVELRNGPDGSAPPLGGRLCGATPPSFVQTTDNDLHVRFVSDGSNEAQGFKLTFEAHSQACGGFIELGDSDPPGYITSPNYPSNYPQNIDCIWVISVPNGEAVQLDFEDEFYIEPNTDCRFDYLEVRDGASSDANLINKLCGNTRPSTQHSTGPVMYLRFRTDTSVTHKGFKAKYSIATCGGTYIGQSGTIRSPGFPTTNYPDGSNCEWYLEGPTGHYLTLTYTTLNLTSSADCTSDYVEIREYNASGQLLGKHCGTSTPAPMDTGDSFAYVKFVSDSSGNAPGFSLTFTASVEECGGDLNLPSGTISSPNYPNLYPHSRTCRWHIAVPTGRRVTLTINDLRLQTTGSGSCNYDYVDVFNGLVPNAPRLERLCGTVPAGLQIRSSGNTMAVVFRTDSSVSNGGFTADYSSEEEAVCGGVITGPDGGNITSPNYGVGNYTNQLNCEWLFQNSQHVNSSIVVIINDLHLENHQTCNKDYIEFRLGDHNGEFLARFCGQSVPGVPIVVFTPELWVHFLTDSSEVDTGFKATYSFSDCGGWQTGEGGVIASPAYPNNYPGPSRCAWLLEAPQGHTITLTFSYFHVEEHSTCRWDSVTIFNGGSPGSPIIGQYCGQNSPGTVKSGSNKLAIVFLADSVVSRGGFIATWSADSSGCGGIIHADTGSIKSPNYPQNFEANIECSWTVIAHEGNHLEMSFNSEFQIPDASGQCQNSFIKVWSGNEETNAGLLATGCGNTPPAPIIAPFNVITARFQSSESVGKGFSFSFYTRCGANFSAPQGRVVSPNYPQDYPSRSNCSYLIDAGAQTVIVLSFRTFQIEGHSTCRYDGVKIYDGVDMSGTPLATLCGNTIPGKFSSFGPMLVNFYSDSVIQDNGFLAEYRAIPCGGIFNGTAGTVSSPTLSHTDYHHNINCTYHIMVGNNRVVDLKFNTFQLEASSNCRYDYVAVYDGDSSLAPLLGQFCGRELPPKLRTSSNHMFIVFRTDATVSGLGWRATYQETLGPQQGCGGYLSSSQGMFGSPDINFDGLYEHYMDCLWTIAAPANKALNLTFSTFELEQSSNCRYDYVKIYDGDSASYPLVGTYCGNIIPASFLSTGNFLTFQFVTDGSVNRRGFNATYTVVDSVCGGAFNVTSSPQTITSPMYPNAYPPFTRCRWVLDAPALETIKVAVQQFRLQPSQSCNLNYLEFKDWPLGDYGQAHKFCGTDNHVPDFYSYGRTMFVTFKSDVFMAGNGFSLTYQVAGCSRMYNQSYGYLKSPGWPSVYPHNIDCSIILQAPQNSSISLFFSSFDLESHPSCNFDFLEVRSTVKP